VALLNFRAIVYTPLSPSNIEPDTVAAPEVVTEAAVTAPLTVIDVPEIAPVVVIPDAVTVAVEETPPAVRGLLSESELAANVADTKTLLTASSPAIETVVDGEPKVICDVERPILTEPAVVPLPASIIMSPPVEEAAPV